MTHSDESIRQPDSSLANGVEEEKKEPEKVEEGPHYSEEEMAQLQIVRDYYECKDPHKWTVQFDDPDFKQSRVIPEGSIVEMMKFFIRIPASAEACIDTILDFDRRMKWDKDIIDARTFDVEEGHRTFRLYHGNKCPATVSDRDFYLYNCLRRNWPEQGTHTMYGCSIPPDEKAPLHKKRVRAFQHIISCVWKEAVDPKTGKECCEMFQIQQLDLNGSIPKWITNNFSKNVPKQFFKKYTNESIRYDKEVI